MTAELRTLLFLARRVLMPIYIWWWSTFFIAKLMARTPWLAWSTYFVRYNAYDMFTYQLLIVFSSPSGIITGLLDGNMIAIDLVALRLTW